MRRAFFLGATICCSLTSRYLTKTYLFKLRTHLVSTTMKTVLPPRLIRSKTCPFPA
jgi:hypothetical protein